MIPLEISVEDYVKHFPPGPNYIVVQRMFDYERALKRQSLYMPRQVVEQMPRFIGVGKVLAVSPYESEFDHINKMKEIVMRPEHGYVVFNFHVAEDVKIMHELVLPENNGLVLLCIQDIVQIPYHLDELLKRQREHEESVEEGMKQSNVEKNNFILQGGEEGIVRGPNLVSLHD